MLMRRGSQNTEFQSKTVSPKGSQDFQKFRNIETYLPIPNVSSKPYPNFLWVISYTFFNIEETCWNCIRLEKKENEICWYFKNNKIFLFCFGEISSPFASVVFRIWNFVNDEGNFGLIIHNVFVSFITKVQGDGKFMEKHILDNLVMGNFEVSPFVIILW